MGGGAEGRAVEVSYGREYVERSTHKSRLGTDWAECLDGEDNTDDEAGESATEGESDEDKAGTAEPEPA